MRIIFEHNDPIQLKEQIIEFFQVFGNTNVKRTQEEPSPSSTGTATIQPTQTEPEIPTQTIEEKPKKKLGRPPITKTTVPKKEYTELNPADYKQPVETSPSNIEHQVSPQIQKLDKPVTPPAAPTLPTKDQVMGILQEVNKHKGLTKARELLLQFGCQRLSEVPEEKYGEFFEVCQTCLAS